MIYDVSSPLKLHCSKHRYKIIRGAHTATQAHTAAHRTIT